MRKLLLLPLMYLITLSVYAQATDTLTVGEVFDYAIGDTFDYQYRIQNPSVPNGQITFARYVITGKIVSPNADTITYVRQRADASHTIDTLRYGNTATTIFQYQINNGQTSWSYFTSGISDWDSIYNSFPGNVPGVSRNVQFEKGLGNTLSYSFATGSGAIDEAKLIYYSKGLRKAGTPYYDQPSGVNDIFASSAKIFPNPCSSVIRLSIPGSYAGNAEMIITDMLGQKVYSSTITAGETSHDLSDIPAGIYTWRLSGKEAIIKTGKMVKE